MSAVDGVILAPSDCSHDWQPVSMVFESQLLDGDGRVLIRQPDIDEGRVFLVCLQCASHTYVSTSWVGFRLYGSEDANPRYVADASGNPVENPSHRLGRRDRGFTAEDRQEADR